CRDRMNGMRAADRLRACFGQPEESYLAFAYELCHGANCFFDWRVRIDTMLIIKIDHFKTESAQTSVACLVDIIRLSANPAVVRPGGITQDPKFCRNDDVFTMSA